MEIISQAETILKYLIAGVSVLVIIVILLQVRSGGLGAAFGGSSAGGEAYRSKRGIEAVFFNSTIILTTVFAVASLVLAAINV